MPSPNSDFVGHVRLPAFWDAIHPLAAKSLEAACARRNLLIPRGIWQAATIHVAQLASDVVLHTLVQDFHAYRMTLGARVRAGEHWRYDRYIRQIERAGGILRYLAAWPAAHESFVQVLRSGTLAMVDFFHHLCTDADVIERIWGLDLDGFVWFEATDSDPHRGQRRVLVVTNGKVKVVYKPRSLSPETAIYEAMTALNTRNQEARFSTVAIRDYRDHGWMSYVPPQSPATPEGLERFAGQMGDLLALAWVLNLSDLHAQNIVASGSGPVLVDAETLFQPTVRTSLDFSIGGGDRNFTVVDTHMLPWPVRNGDDVYDTSSIGASSGAPTGGQRLILKDVNTDRMTLEWRPEACPSFGVPSLHGCLDSQVLQDSLVMGFQRTLESVTTEWDIIESLASKAAAGELLRRVVLRSSAVYERLLHRATSADFAKSPQRRRDVLTPELPVRTDRYAELRRCLLRAELESLDRADFPYATLGQVGSSVAMCSGAELQDAVAYDPLRALERPTAGRITQEASLIRTAVAVADITQRSHVVSPTTRSGPVDTVENVVEGLLDGLWEAGLLPRDPDGPWFSIEYEPPRLVRSDSTLYTGAPGVACLLAAVVRVDRGQAELCAGLLTALIDRIEEGLYLDLDGRIGALDGVAGVLLAVRFIERLVPGLVPPTLVTSLADEVANGIERHLDSGEPLLLDLTSGLAGGLVALSGLEGSSHKTASIRAARTLVSSQSRDGSWRDTREGNGLCGAAHGASGIVLALAHGHLSTRAALAAVSAALRFESANYDADADGWTDLRDDPPGQGMPAVWCHGAVGIMRSRLAAAAWIDPSTDIDRGLASIATWPASNDRLCCGVAGQLDALLSFGSEPRFERLRASLTQDLVRRARHPQTLRFEASLRNLPWPFAPPGLFRGVSGVAYVLLRLANPQLPSPFAVLEPAESGR